jgi:hypothetical protein
MKANIRAELRTFSHAAGVVGQHMHFMAGLRKGLCRERRVCARTPSAEGRELSGDQT